MTVPLTLLGLLDREPSHGYDLKRDYDSYFGRGKPLPFGQVYATLGRLARDGKVLPGEVEPGSGPERKRYAITEMGRHEVESWLSQPIEPEPHLRSIAEQAAGIARVPIKLVDSRAEQLPADDGSFDAVVATLMLCSVSDPGVVLAEMRRVLRPGGELAFMEHVRADTPGYRRIQQLADATIWPTCCGGCHASRDPVSAIEAAGFTIRDLTRYRLPDSRIPWPTAPHARGVAVRTEA